MDHLLQKGAHSLVGGLVAFTLAWIAWGLATSGDSFPPGSPLFFPSVALAVVIGAGLGWLLYGYGRPARYALAVSLALVAAFWGFVPDGWWAHELEHVSAVGVQTSAFGRQRTWTE